MAIFKQLQGDIGDLTDMCNDLTTRRPPSTPTSAKLGHSPFSDELSPRGKTSAPVPPSSPQPPEAKRQLEPVLETEANSQRRRQPGSSPLHKGQSGSSLSLTAPGFIPLSKSGKSKAVSTSVLTTRTAPAPTPHPPAVNGWVKNPYEQGFRTTPRPNGSRGSVSKRSKPPPPPVPKKPSKAALRSAGLTNSPPPPPSVELTPSPKLEPAQQHHASIKQSDSGSASLLSGAEEKAEEEHGQLKASSSLNKLTPGLSRLQEDEAGATISRNSSIDSGIQFVNEGESNNGHSGVSFANEVFSKLGFFDS